MVTIKRTKYLEVNCALRTNSKREGMLTKIASLIGSKNL
jgi:hypothetical protein